MSGDIPDSRPDAARNRRATRSRLYGQTDPECWFWQRPALTLRPRVNIGSIEISTGGKCQFPARSSAALLPPLVCAPFTYLLLCPIESVCMCVCIFRTPQRSEYARILSAPPPSQPSAIFPFRPCANRRAFLCECPNTFRESSNILYIPRLVDATCSATYAI